MSVMLRKSRVDPSVCEHRETEALGSERNAEFLRCRSCGRIVVVQGGHLWVLNPSPGGPENQDFTF
ncbi:MAG: hypothetical protein A3K59_10800 [Euryarchaeota archaeon RBG_19FT_COMBO_69_17]|nr:MAG: hypothetical protein A3K59_10800 [Euryarchaeota archaeon RBG_19FT_COMBO_69_17]